MRFTFKAVGPGLIQGCINRNRNSQKKLYDLLSPIIYTKLLEEVNGQKAAEILLQKVFLKIFTSIQDYNERVLFEEWFMEIYESVVLSTLNPKKF